MAKRKRRRKSKSTSEMKRTLKYEITGLIMAGLAVISIAKLGAFGVALSMVARFFMGEWEIILLISLFLLALYLMWKRDFPPFAGRRMIGIYLIVGSILLLSHVKLFQLLSEGGPFEKPSVIQNTFELFWMEATSAGANPSDLGGGMLGALLFALFHFLFASAGARIAGLITLIVGLILVSGKTFGEVFGKLIIGSKDFLKKQFEGLRKEFSISQKKEKKPKKEKTVNPIAEPAQEIEEYIEATPIDISSFSEKAKYEQPQETRKVHVIPDETTVLQEEAKLEEIDVNESTQPLPFVEVENAEYQLPPLSLLQMAGKSDQTKEYKRIHENAAKLERTFSSFGVNAKVTQVHLGPAVTKYEVHPAVGVKVSKIVSLSDDIALALAAKGIRIEAPIPGKSAIGIEVPNSEVAMVSLREVLDSKQSLESDSKLLIGLGRDVAGDAVMAKLNKMPHLLVAGATGSGKSVCINGIITSILMRAKPHEVKLMMIDPKMVELNMYNGIPHLLAPVVTDAKKASQALKKVVNEMERRYELFAHTGTRNIEGYNDHIKLHNMESEAKQSLLPYIVVIVDELADLMMVASSDVEDAITRLAQMARAAGIHLIIATQRPSVDVITGVIKANIPSRIAFSVSSATDSRTILDMGGAEKLLGRGDMLFLPVGASKPIRVQGAFLSDQEVEEIVDYVISQQKAQYHEDMIPDDTQTVTEEVADELYDSAVQLVIEMETASVSMLQRRFRIGYSRAARLIDEMEARGIVGPYEGSKPRVVLVNKEDLTPDVKHS
ncbi:DNA translocase FtsK [Bacillus sp. AGMB 02131]|uniref:DNA translocase FtsK n=1 Tax=Peribacillus faecalis TaxID=2772559 RepID=A0A927CX76_9BACI|nr:DNA translocase FtsK [Peribacillus faecalis]MBD3109383.1 DNA translocase FtsK [Peribacillus faecalis]